MPFRSSCPTPFRLVAPADVERIHTVALEVLAEIGVRFADPAALRFLAENGCDVDRVRQIARMPAELVEDGLRRCPSQFTLHARSSAYDIVFDSTGVHFAAGSGMGSIVYLPMTDAKLPDEQAGYEKAMQWLLAGLAGINLIWGAGMVEGHTLWSNAQLVIEAEMAGMVGRCLDGVAMDSEALAIDAIRQVGHFPNGYMQTEHTLRRWRAERYLPLVASRDSYEQWSALGRPDVLRRADEKARAILVHHEVTPLPPEVDREIEALLAAAAREKAGA
jgi:trimethylamine:corrinoid methyltransferase-like protein